MNNEQWTMNNEQWLIKLQRYLQKQIATINVTIKEKQEEYINASSITLQV